MGWLTLLGWQVGLASVCHAAALQIQSLTIMIHPEVAFQGWHASLMTIAVALSAVLLLVLRRTHSLLNWGCADIARLRCLPRFHICPRLHGTKLNVGRGL